MQHFSIHFFMNFFFSVLTKTKIMTESLSNQNKKESIFVFCFHKSIEAPETSNSFQCFHSIPLKGGDIIKKKTFSSYLY